MGITKYEKTEKISDSKFAAFGHGKLQLRDLMQYPELRHKASKPISFVALGDTMLDPSQFVTA